MEAHYTELGTRVIALKSGGTILLTKTRDIIELTTINPDKRTVKIHLSTTEALSLIEILSVAARPHSGKTMIDAESFQAALREANEE